MLLSTQCLIASMFIFDLARGNKDVLNRTELNVQRDGKEGLGAEFNIS